MYPQRKLSVLLVVLVQVTVIPSRGEFIELKCTFPKFGGGLLIKLIFGEIEIIFRYTNKYETIMEKVVFKILRFIGRTKLE